MAYNTTVILKDVDQKPIPQYYNSTTGLYEVLQGANGASRHILYSADGNPITVADNKLAVRASEIEALLGTLLTASGYDAKADIALSALRDDVRGTSDKTLTDIATALASLATAANQTAMQALIGTLAAAAVTDPASTTATLLQLVKGIIKQLQTGIPLSGSIESIAAAPVAGIKTVTATAAEMFAGALVKANRRKLIIRNEDVALRLRIGPSTVTQQNGYPIEPGATVEIQFDPATAVAIYGISEGAALSAAVMEV